MPGGQHRDVVLLGEDPHGAGPGRRPRPAAASGRVTTPTTSWREASSAARLGTATSGVPARTSRTQRAAPKVEWGLTSHRRCLQAGPLGLTDHPHGLLLLLPVQAVDEQDAVQVVGLVLHRPGEQRRALDPSPAPRACPSPWPPRAWPAGCRRRSRGRTGSPPRPPACSSDRSSEGLTRWPSSPSTYQVNTRSPTPICGAASPAPGASSMVSSRSLTRLPELLVERGDLDRRGAQHGVAEEPDVLERHGVQCRSGRAPLRRAAGAAPGHRRRTQPSPGVGSRHRGWQPLTTWSGSGRPSIATAPAANPPYGASLGHEAPVSPGRPGRRGPRADPAPWRPSGPPAGP